jgi:dipeptidyl aminopeptidase/acylaminoacyl peptidase
VRLAWSSDGSRLLALGSHEALIYDARGTLVRQVSSGSPIRDGAVSPDGRMLALVRGGVSDQVTIGPLTATKSQPERVLLAGEGLRNLAWSPDGNWLLVSWPVADQWAFVRVVGRPRIVAASRISQQFSSRAAPRGFPRLEGWCCTSIGTAT